MPRRPVQGPQEVHDRPRQVQGLHGLRPGLPRQRHQRHPQEPARHQPAGLHQVRHLRREVQIRSNHR